MKIIIYTILFLIITSCSSTSNNADIKKSFKNIYNLESSIKNFHTSNFFHLYNYRYKIVYIDTRNWTRHKKEILATRKVIEKFATDLGKKAIVVNLIDKTSKKRNYVNKIQEELGEKYNLDSEAPFLLFYKLDKSTNTYKAYKIISIASISLEDLNNKLSQLSDAINAGKSPREVTSNLNQIKSEDSLLNKFIKTLKSIF